MIALPLRIALVQEVSNVPVAGQLNRQKMINRQMYRRAGLELLRRLLGWQEVEAMFGLSELKQTRVYQQGREEGERSLILRQLSRRLGPVSEEEQSRISVLTLEQLEALGESLLDFSTVDDLRGWLATNAQQPAS